IKNSCVLDIHFPDHKTAALLIHKEYTSVITNKLLKLGIDLKDDFNPLDPSLIEYPKLADLSNADREAKILEVHHGYLMKALTFIHAPVKFSVARCFYLRKKLHRMSMIKSTPHPKPNPCHHPILKQQQLLLYNN
ncbi:hypothetical protein BDB00DRAFT_767204, partial [Zychaea mexicana]|uniref:uncharacterized protein n=1 Tax=Zychaea mexicana TaxID=64656 RepID=UPI0022FF3C5C